MRCLWVSWSFMTWLSAMLCTGGCLLPYWLKGTLRTSVEVYSDLGLFRRCVYPVYGAEGEVKLEHSCGHYDFSSIPHRYWQVCLVLLSGACCILFFLTFLLFFLGFCLDLLKLPPVHRACQTAQFLAGILTIIACILYPLGWYENSEVAQICGGGVTPFKLGRCHIGWAFVLTCAGGLLSLLSTTLPFLLDHPCSPIGSQDTNSTPAHHLLAPSSRDTTPPFPRSLIGPGDRRRSSSATNQSDTRKMMVSAGSPAMHCGTPMSQRGGMLGDGGGSTLGSLVNVAGGGSRAGSVVGNPRYSYVTYQPLNNSNPSTPCHQL